VGTVILVADDNQTIRKAACAMLVESENPATCLEAEDGQVAVEMAVQHKPDLVILDYSMPVMDGFEAAKRIHELLPDVPIVLFSLYAAMLEEKKAIEPGFAAVVPKEKAGSLLRPTVRSLLKMQRGNNDGGKLIA